MNRKTIVSLSILVLLVAFGFSASAEHHERPEDDTRDRDNSRQCCQMMDLGGVR